MDALDKAYWNSRYKTNEIGWDTGSITPPIQNYIDQLTNKDIKVMIPGAGNAYEAEYLFEKGFKSTYILDIAEEAINSFSLRVPRFPKEQMICQDFFKHSGQYDLILEQTFFCALNPKLRPNYVEKMHDLLLPEGKLVGVLFGSEFMKEGPPFGGQLEEYKKLFSGKFEVLKLEPCYNSLAPRANNELFISLKKA